MVKRNEGNVAKKWTNYTIIYKLKNNLHSVGSASLKQSEATLLIPLYIFQDTLEQCVCLISKFNKSSVTTSASATSCTVVRCGRDESSKVFFFLWEGGGGAVKDDGSYLYKHRRPTMRLRSIKDYVTAHRNNHCYYSHHLQFTCIGSE